MENTSARIGKFIEAHGEKVEQRMVDIANALHAAGFNVTRTTLAALYCIVIENVDNVNKSLSFASLYADNSPVDTDNSW